MAIDPAWIQAGGQILSGLLKPPEAAPAISGGQNTLAQDFDFSGFTVATGKSTATGAPNNKTSGGAGNGLQVTGNWLPWAIVGGAALAAVLWTR